MRKRAGDRAAHRERFGLGFMQRDEQRLDPAIDRVAGIGQTQMARGALDQPQAQIGFQPLHRSTEARLGMPQHARGRAEAAVLDHLAK